jgi:hypothetical protein
MAEPAADYHRGEMDIVEQSATYKGFLDWSKWGSLAICAGVLFFALIFCTEASLLQAGGATFVLLVVGILALKDKKTPGH